MNLWPVATQAFAAALLLVGLGVLRGDLARRAVALQMAGVLGTLVILCLAAWSGHSYLVDLAFALVLVSFTASLALAHFLERWL